MGGMGGTVEGTTKLGTWIAFKREIAQMGLSTRGDQDDRGMYLEFPTSKRQAFGMMVRNEDDTAWVLEYHFHS